MFALHRNEKYFSNPESFIPERWGGACQETSNRKAFLAWGHGPHECLGKWYLYVILADLRLAIMELKMLLAGIILKFDVEWVDECKDPMADLWSQVDPVHLRLQVI
jgi:cytochrome P450